MRPSVLKSNGSSQKSIVTTSPGFCSWAGLVNWLQFPGVDFSFMNYVNSSGKLCFASTDSSHTTMKLENNWPISYNLITVSINHWCNDCVPELGSGLGEVEMNSMYHTIAMSEYEGSRWVAPLPGLQDRHSLPLPCTATVQCNHKGPGRTLWGNKWYSVRFCSMISNPFNKLCQMSGLSYWGFIH